MSRQKGKLHLKRLSLSVWLAKHFYKGYRQGDEHRHNATGIAVTIATIGVALGLAVMLVAVSVVRGFQNEVSSKLTGFASHIVIQNDSSFIVPDGYSVVADTAFLKQIKDVEHVAQVQCVTQKVGVLKTNDAYQAIVLKGIGQDYDEEFLKAHIVEGVFPEFTDSAQSGYILLSDVQSKKMGVGLGDKIYAYFFEEHIRARRFEVAGIYRSYMPQFDNHIAYTDRYTVNRLNGWGRDECSYIAVDLENLQSVDDAQIELQYLFEQNADKTKNYSHLSIKENPQTASAFAWLEVLNLNVWAILAIMMGVACFTMISGLLILILERTQTIGVLKALGLNNSRLQQTFIAYAALIVGRGLLLGNMIGLGLVAAQHYGGFVTLDPENYYVSIAPVAFDVWWVIGINILTLVITLMSLIVPSLLVYRIEPAKAIRFE